MGYIIHVDNSDFFRKVTNVLLAKLGYESLGYARAEDALDMALTGKADCVITGLELADMTGEDFIKQLTISAEMIPVIVITSRDDEEEFDRLKTLGVKAIIQKADNWEEELRMQLASLTEEAS